MIQPLHDYVLLKEETKETSTNSGILLSATQTTSEYARVIALGNEITHTEYFINDLVLYNKSNIRYVSINNEQYMLVKDADIIAVNKE